MKNNYNERSWAIDVISEINLIVSQKKKTIRRAGGERTLKASVKSNSLFPDVLLFQDDQNLKILQGWELKMPDTPITDEELLENAIKKANLLGLNSFLVWNVSEAALYISENEIFSIAAQWFIPGITKRDEVEANRQEWVNTLKDIIDSLEDFFIKGRVKSQNILETFSENKIIDVILSNIGLVKQNISKHRAKDALLDASIEEWWSTVSIEYSAEPDKYSAVAKLVLLSWINRFLFAHYLKKFTKKAFEIDDLDETTTVKQANKYFDELTKDSDFLNVYSPVIAEDYIDDVSWEQILQINLFFSELRLQDIDQALLQQLFEQLLLSSKRKAAGQYATPYGLADYFARLVIKDKNLFFLDAFCGTGTILRSAYDLKTEFGITPTDAINTIWGSDKFSFPLQMSTLSLAKAEIIGKVINVFKSDVKDLKTGKAYDFIDPNDGKTVTKKLPDFDYIISNLPFVEAAKIKDANPKIYAIEKQIAAELKDANFSIPSKSDLLAYLPYYLWYLLKPGGRLGIIVSNSWLGTDWGQKFRSTLNNFFKIENVVTSGEGKWFANANVITNLVILEKRPSPIVKIPDNEHTDFTILKVPVSSLADKATVSQLAAQTLLKRNNANISVKTIARDRMQELEKYGLNWSAYFTDLSWFDQAKPKLIKASTLFEINRGERRGWDAMFFPTGKHNIERKYLKPVLKNSRHVTTLIADPDGTAFCCSATMAQLKKENSLGTIAWINKFKNANNEKGIPLTTSLLRANHFWYEMKQETVADLISTLNFYEKIFIAKMQKRSFVNQRLIRFTVKKSKTDIDLCHALLNSIIGIFFIEALGFGRGLGALDLNSTKLKNDYCMLDPSLLDAKQQAKIKKEFSILMKRNIEKVNDEYDLRDRIAFEKTVAEAYGLLAIMDDVKNSLFTLYNIRTKVR